ncbi:ABC transporter permease [Stratiformator vulcanicus]|uniref:Aliphatic sulfonates transport permease protein SsuC n=1 Tax=Stratiformator vulcanicus TaxID=2527980 RepID=A0A517QXC0_9PLAN|nr:ABC transporter permease [Stratiformator vulcanicus]QDT36281.1 Putative aliphatic sulfonates transport permease protein SsuC [Stratiformator vulcanicus]
MTGWLWRALPPVAVLLATVIAWQLIVSLGELPRYLLPSPYEVSSAVAARPLHFATATVRTLIAALAGFMASLILGVAIAIVFAQSRIIRTAFYPYAIFLQTVPIVAIAPLLILWLGYGLQSVIAVSLVVSLFPIIANTTAGLTRVPPEYLRLFRLYQTGRLRELRLLRLPHAVPNLITGAKTSAGLAVIGAIVGEFFAGYGSGATGLGQLIKANADQSRTPELFASVLLATLLGVLIFGLVNLAGNTILRTWYEE